MSDAFRPLTEKFTTTGSKSNEVADDVTSDYYLQTKKSKEIFLSITAEGVTINRALSSEQFVDIISVLFSEP